MANPIPPLLCSTPPPIDFDEESSANNDTIDELCEFDAGDSETFDGQSLPSTPSHLTHTINKKVVDSLSVTKDKINISDDDETENRENIYCDDKIESMSKVVETETQSAILSLELDVNKVIETHKSEVVEEPICESLSNFEETSDIDKSLKLFSKNLSECDYDCVFANDEKHVAKNIDNTEDVLLINQIEYRFNDKNEILKDDENVRPLEEGDVKKMDKSVNIEGLRNIEINELGSACKNETLKSSIEYISDIEESNSENIKSNIKHINTEDLSLITKEIEESVTNTIIENDIDTVIDNVDRFGEQNIENTWSDKINVDEEISNFTFEADFSQFQSFESFKPTNSNENNSRSPIDNIKVKGLKQDENSKESFDDEEDEFENFQNYSSSQSENFLDKDDSNEFTDFKEAALPPALSDISSTSQANLKIILDTMFPLSDSDNSTNMDINIVLENDDGRPKKSIILNPVDSATALNFQWSDSTIKHSLVKSIGIDSRNILHGEKWNSSMPRFAANLSFNPLEPLKPVKLDSTANTTFFLENEPSTSLGKTVTNRSDVPAVEFDWNTSGLVNPLDGIKEVIHERKNETLHTKQAVELQDTIQPLSKTENNIINDHKCSGSSNSNDKKLIGKIHEDEQSMHTKEYLPTTCDINLIIEQSPQEPCTVTKNNNNLESNKNLDHLIYTNYQNCENIDIISTPSSSNNANTFIVPLKETHIFTPSKSDAAVSRSTINISETTTSDNGKSCIPVDFDYEIAAAGTVIDETVIKKEYRDIEYNPNKFVLITLDKNSIQLNNENQNSLNVLEKSEIITEPFAYELCVTTNGDWETYNNNANKEIFDKKFINKNNTNLTKELSINTNDEGISNFQYDLCEEKFNNFLKPTIGLSPTENLIIQNEFSRENKEFENDQIKKDSTIVDDEFTDFQFVPPTSSTLVTNSFPTKTINASDIKNPRAITNHSIDKINRTNTIPDQMILSPAILLPQSVQINNCEPKIEWPEPGIDPEELSRIETLFPSSTKHNDFYSQGSSALNHISSTNNISKNAASVNNDDDWSDFISVPAVNTSVNNLNTIYCPKSPTKVSKSIITTTTTTAEFNNDDEWSDFISSIPSSTNIMNTSSGQFNKNDIGTLKKNSLYNNSYYPSSITENTSQQKYKINIPNQKTVNNSNHDQTVINNKICQYLLNNGNIESRDTTMNLNTLKTTDYLSHPIYQQQNDISQKNINRDQLNHHKIAPSISLIPDLGYVAPQNLISIPKSNLQKK